MRSTTRTRLTQCRDVQRGSESWLTYLLVDRDRPTRIWQPWQAVFDELKEIRRAVEGQACAGESINLRVSERP